MQEGVFLVRGEVYPLCIPRGLTVFQPEDGGEMFVRNLGT
jgi:hypothetical protein